MISRVKNRQRRRFLQLSMSAAAWLCSGVLGCGPNTDDQTTAATTGAPISDIELTAQAEDERNNQGPAPGLLRIAMSSLPNTFDPPLFTTPGAYICGFIIYDSLVWLDQSLTPQPRLAEHWESDKTGRQWTFQLRRDARFHHNTPFTAEDVVYTMTRLLDPTLNSPQLSVLGFINEVKALDAYTVRFSLDTPNPDLPLLLAAPQTCILAHDYPIKQMLTNPSGTGPFRFSALLRGEHVYYIRNQDYWAADQIPLTEIQQIHIGDFAEQVTALLQDEVDLLVDIEVDAIDQLTANPDTVVLEAPSGRYQPLVMRVNGTPFHDNRVRQALKACIDRTALQQQVLYGRGEVGNDHPVPAISPYWADLPLQSQDYAKARQLLAEAGYTTGLQLQLVTANAAPGMVKLAQVVQAMAKPAGIQIEVIEVKVSGDIYFGNYWGRPPFFISIWEFRPSIYETFAIGYYSQSAWNETGLVIPKLDQVLDEARGALDPERRKTLYKEAQQLMIEEGAVIIPYFQPVLTALRKRVQGFMPHPAGWVDLRNVQIV